MERRYNKIFIRNAKTEDAEQLCRWWNDGSVMEHAGFPNGLGTTIHEVLIHGGINWEIYSPPLIMN